MSSHPSPRRRRVRTGVVATVIGATVIGGLGVADPAGAARAPLGRERRRRSCTERSASTAGEPTT